jgi:heat shock transcription factor
MVKKSNEGGPSVAPFLLKCYEIVDDRSTDSLISWGSTNDCFVIWDSTHFSSQLLPKYFKHNTFSSFVRQLNIYGFRKTDTDRWEFANDGFIKGQKHLLKNIIRRKNAQSLVHPKSSEQEDKNIVFIEGNKDDNLWKEVESLKIDKNVLMQELVSLRQHQETSQSKLLLLKKQLKGMEQNQQQMLSFIVMAMQSPGFLVQLIQPKENNWRMSEPAKNILEEVIDDQEPFNSEGMIVRYQPPLDDEPVLVFDNDDSLDLSSDVVRDLFMNYNESLENHSPLILSDLPDGDGMLEQLLENQEEGKT